MKKKILPILFATLLLDMIGIGMIIPIIPIIFTDPTSPSFLLNGYSQGMQYFIAGMATALFGFMQFIAAPILGELSDMYGRKRLLTLGVAVLAFAQLLFAIGIAWASLGLLLFSRAIAGLAGANFSIAQASISDVTEPKDRAKNFGLIGAAFGIGFILGPLLGGWLAEFTGHVTAPFWFAGILGICNVAFISFFLPETLAVKGQARQVTIMKGISNIRDALRDNITRSVYLSSFLYISGFSFFTSFIGILLVAKYGFSGASVGTFFGVSGVWIVITQIFVLRAISSKYNERQVLRWSLLFLAFAIGMQPFMPNAVFLYLFVPLLAIPQGLTIANIGALISHSVPQEKQGVALGINGSLMALSQGLIPLIAGVSSSLIGLEAPFIAGAVFVLVAWGVLYFRK